MARLALVKVGDVHLSPLRIQAVKPAENGTVVLYENGNTVGILGVTADEAVGILNRAVDRGAGALDRRFE